MVLIYGINNFDNITSYNEITCGVPFMALWLAVTSNLYK